LVLGGDGRFGERQGKGGEGKAPPKLAKKKLKEKKKSPTEEKTQGGKKTKKSPVLKGGGGKKVWKKNTTEKSWVWHSELKREPHKCFGLGEKEEENPTGPNV